MRSLNQAQLAKQLRLSRSTVSRSLSNHPAIAAATRARVQRLAAQLGYRSAPVRAVRRPRGARPITFGVLVGQLSSLPGPGNLPKLLAGIHRRAAIDRVAIDLLQIEPAEWATAAGRRRGFRHLRQADWRGAVLLYPFAPDTVRLLARKITLVSVLADVRDLDVIDADPADLATLVQASVRQGHQRIGFVADPEPVNRDWSLRSYAAYAEALAAHGLMPNPRWCPNLLASPSPTGPAPSALADLILEAIRQAGVTVWICATDAIAYRLIADLTVRGLRIPQDCSITGFGGQEPPSALPELTTLRTPCDELGACAVAQLGSRLLDPAAPRQRILVETTFVAGATLAPPPS